MLGTNIISMFKKKKKKKKSSAKAWQAFDDKSRFSSFSPNMLILIIHFL